MKKLKILHRELQLKNLSSQEKLKNLGLTTQAFRRIKGDMIEVYKIIHKKYDPETSYLFKLASETGISHSTKGNSNKIIHQHFNTSLR